MKSPRLSGFVLAWLITCLALPPAAWAADGTIGTNGPAMLDKSTNRVFCSKASEGPVVVMQNATKSFNACTTLTLSSTDIGAATGTGNATYLPKWTATATGTGTTNALGNSVVSDDGTNAIIGAPSTSTSTSTLTVSALARLDVRGTLDNTQQETLLSLSKRNDADRGWKFVAGLFNDSVWGQYSLRIGPQAVNNYNGHFVLGMGAGMFRVGAGRPLTANALTDFTDRFAILNNGNVCIGSIDCATPLAVNTAKTFTVDTSGNVAAANITATPGASKIVQSLATSNKIDTGWLDTGTGPTQVVTGADSRLTDARASTNTLYATDGIVFVLTTTVTATDSLTQSQTKTATSSQSFTNTGVTDQTFTYTATDTGTGTTTFSQTTSGTSTGTGTITGTVTVTVTGTMTFSVTDAYIGTATKTGTATATATGTATGTYSKNTTASWTFTRTSTATGTKTYTKTQSGVGINMGTTLTGTATATATVSATATLTGTRTETATATEASAEVASDPTLAYDARTIPGGDMFFTTLERAYVAGNNNNLLLCDSPSDMEAAMSCKSTITAGDSGWLCGVPYVWAQPALTGWVTAGVYTLTVYLRQNNPGATGYVNFDVGTWDPGINAFVTAFTFTTPAITHSIYRKYTFSRHWPAGFVAFFNQSVGSAKYPAIRGTSLNPGGISSTIEMGLGGNCSGSYPCDPPDTPSGINWPAVSPNVIAPGNPSNINSGCHTS